MTMATTLASGAGDGPAPSSASTAVTTRASHVLKIDGYSSTLSANRYRSLSSFPFNAGGHTLRFSTSDTWHINYRRLGSSDSSRDYISFYLVLEDQVVEDDTVTAQITFSLLDQDRKKPVPAHTHIPPDRSASHLIFILRKDLEVSEHLKDDCFAIGVDVVSVTKDEVSSVKVPPPSDMHRHYGDLLSSKLGTDVEFVVGGEMFTAHRLVLAARSPVFKIELFRTTEERTTPNAIPINDTDAQVFRAMLSFIYTDTWPEIDQENEAAMAQHLLIAAERYGLDRLKLMCEDRLCNGIIDMGSVTAINLVLAENHYCHSLKKACSWTTLAEFMATDDFRYLTKSCPGILNDLICNVVARERERTIFFLGEYGKTM
uniref:BTB domain-containing protein n=1 Tax=Oryza barthii TaxID=65489 RepID=A0A0D3HE29_9ORYZ